MYRTVVLTVVGLTPRLLGEATPNLAALVRTGGMRPLETILPAVTCAVQSTFTTGMLPRGHGCVANGWYFRELSEVWLWRQSDRLVAGEKIWEAAARRDPAFTCAKLFWWYNMYSSATYAVTPRPMYPADGRKIPDIYAEPPELREELTARLGAFPLFDFWGPAAGIRSSRWIADCARHVYDTRRPTLMLVYLPHLDYNLQRWGPRSPRIRDDLAAIDSICGELVDHVRRDGARVIVVSEYGITDVSGAVHVNRALREAGFVRVREELGRELLDAGASEAFAVADHQVAHVYVKRAERVADVKGLLETLPGSRRCSTGMASGRTGSTIHAPESSSPSPRRTAGSRTITGWTMQSRPISRRRWTSTASRATTRSSSSSIPASRCRSSRSAGSWCARRSGSAT